MIDATGNSKSMSHALNYVAHTGRLVYVGITTENVTFAHPLMHRRELTALCLAQCSAGRFRPHHPADRRRAIDTSPWITHRSRFDELISNFPSYTRPETGVIKAVVEVRLRGS